MKGISIFPGLDHSVKENVDYMEKAFRNGMEYIFTSVHIPESDRKRVKDEFEINEEELKMWKERIVDCDLEEFIKNDEDEVEDSVLEKRKEKILSEMENLFNGQKVKKHKPK